VFGGLHSVGLRLDGSLAAWGHNSAGQCDVPSGSNFVAVACGGYHSLALRSDGAVSPVSDSVVAEHNPGVDVDFALMARYVRYRCLSLLSEPATLGLLGLAAVLVYSNWLVWAGKLRRVLRRRHQQPAEQKPRAPAHLWAGRAAKMHG
jgi:hypothetical protein